MEKDFNINVYEIVGTSRPFGRTSEDGTPSGDTIRQLANDNWDKYEKINILFEGVARMTRGFMDEAIAKLLDDHSLEEFNAKIHFPDAKESIVKELNECIKLRLKIIRIKKEREAEGKL